MPWNCAFNEAFGHRHHTDVLFNACIQRHMANTIFLLKYNCGVFLPQPTNLFSVCCTMWTLHYLAMCVEDNRAGDLFFLPWVIYLFCEIYIKSYCNSIMKQECSSVCSPNNICKTILCKRNIFKSIRVVIFYHFSF